jgi:hypothetical protein
VDSEISEVAIVTVCGIDLFFFFQRDREVQVIKGVQVVIYQCFM